MRARPHVDGLRYVKYQKDVEQQLSRQAHIRADEELAKVGGTKLLSRFSVVKPARCL
jgi:hypothetical protein